jgi:phosphoglycerate kinase
MADLDFDTVADLPDSAETLLVRLDLNSPIEDGRAQDNKRFERHAETVAELAGAGYRVVLMAHQGRPGRDSYVSLETHADVLEERLSALDDDTPDVEFVDDVYGEDARGAIDSLDTGDVLLLQNVRFVDAELADNTPAEHAETDFVQSLSDAADAYVNDAYSAAHRAHASIVGFPRVLPAVAGPVMADEYAYNTSIREMEFDGEVTMALGGTKAADLIAVMESVDDFVDTFVLGGVIGELFLRAAGYDVGFDVGDADLYDDQWAENGERIEALAERYGGALHLPVDLAYEDDAGDRGEVDVEGIEKDRPYLDVGSKTVRAYEPIVERSEAVFVKGALGVFEDERFAHGTRGLLEAIAGSDCYTVVGGGDTARAIDMYDVGEEHFDHVSIAGGAYARALTGAELDAITALTEAATMRDQA